MSPMGAPVWFEDDDGGKTVESVARGVRWRMRRACTADSYVVGISKSVVDGGLESMCWGGVLVARARGTASSGRMKVCIFASGREI